MTGPTMTLRRLGAVQHVLFVVLVVVCLGRALAIGAPLVALLSSVGSLVAWYAVGAQAATTRIGALQDDRDPGGLGSEGARGPGPQTGRDAGKGASSTALSAPRGRWWLLGLVAVWIVTVAVTPEMVWVAFSLWLLAGQLLPLRLAAPVGLVVLAVVIAGPWRAGELTVAGVVGPTVGGAFALALSHGMVLIVRDSLERQRLVASLVASQQETEVLHAELAETQRAAGVLSERTRLSRDIHDSLAQGFSSILLLARASTATQDPARHRHLLAQIETSAAEHLDEARRVVGALAPAPLESGLVEALRRIADRFRDETGTSAEVRVEGDVTALTPVLEVALLRTAQAALANVRQHAAASRVVLTLAEAVGSVRLDVVDDGRGFDPAAVPQSPPAVGGYGIRASRDRLRELGGDLTVESEPGGGTAVSAFVPLWVDREAGS